MKPILLAVAPVFLALAGVFLYPSNPAPMLQETNGPRVRPDQPGRPAEVPELPRYTPQAPWNDGARYRIMIRTAEDLNCTEVSQTEESPIAETAWATIGGRSVLIQLGARERFQDDSEIPPCTCVRKWIQMIGTYHANREKKVPYAEGPGYFDDLEIIGAPIWIQMDGLCPSNPKCKCHNGTQDRFPPLPKNGPPIKPRIRDEVDARRTAFSLDGKWKELGPERAREFLRDAAARSKTIAFDGHDRFARVWPDAARDPSTGQSWDLLELSAILDLESVRSRATWTNPPGLIIEGLGFTPNGLIVKAKVPSDKGTLKAREFSIGWRPGEKPRAGLFSKALAR